VGHDLIATVALGLSVAFAGGVLAHLLRLPVIVGYLVAGMVVGPFTPGPVADSQIAAELAEVGVILLMFGVGIHFSIKDLASVWRIAVPGAGLASLWGWSTSEGLLLGLTLSVASTVVLLRGLGEAGTLESRAGRTAVGWLIVEDLVVVIALVLRPCLGGSRGQRGGRRGDDAQICEFSFILMAAGQSLDLIPGDAPALVLAAALISIVANPFLLRGARRLAPAAALRARPAPA
jgi:CPA2 family monovalent cation:H+ antiporter-2